MNKLLILVKIDLAVISKIRYCELSVAYHGNFCYNNHIGENTDEEGQNV